MFKRNCECVCVKILYRKAALFKDLVKKYRVIYGDKPVRYKKTIKTLALRTKGNIEKSSLSKSSANYTPICLIIITALRTLGKIKRYIKLFDTEKLF